MNRGLIGTIIGVLVVIILMIDPVTDLSLTLGID